MKPTDHVMLQKVVVSIQYTGTALVFNLCPLTVSKAVKLQLQYVLTRTL